MATPLHNHTYHSAYDGVSKPVQIAERCVDLGFTSCACTDHDVVSGHIEFFKALSDRGVKPILGIETYQSPVSRYETYKALRDKETGYRLDNFHLLLLAKNDEGLKNLWRLNSQAHKEGFYYNARVDWELLEKYHEGIIATSACGLGMLQQSLEGNPNVPEAHEIVAKYRDIFGDDFYIELSTYPEPWQHSLNLKSAQLAKSWGVPMVYANDAHYSTPDQYELHEAIMALQHNKKLKDLEEPQFKQALYIMGEDEVRDHLSYLGKSVVDEAINNSDAIANLCNVSLPESKKRLPVFIPDKQYANSGDMILDLLEKAYDNKILSYNKDEALYWPRVEKELAVIFDANLVDYFLMVRDYVYWAKLNGIMVGPGRGSVGGSLVAYLLGITEVDPIRYGLIFERFYNAGREKSLPDIDIDFSKEGRDRVKEYVTDKYGEDYVADLGTAIRLKPKSAINDLGRVMSISMKTTQAISKIIDKAIDAGLQPNWDTIMENHGEELAPYLEEYPQLFEWARELSRTDDDLKDDHIKTFGTHASGVIVGDEPLSSVFPLRWVAKDKKLVTQWDMRDAEELGFMKADLLGLRNLDTLTEMNRILEDTGQEPINFEAVQYMDHPEELWQLLDNGMTVGLFQVEDGGMAKQIGKVMKPRSIDDLGILVAMNRPGPLRSGAFDRFMQGRRGEAITYKHEIQAQATSETFGEFIFQEQVIEFFTLIGYTLEEADDIRSLMGKKKVEKLVKEKPRYLKAAANFMSEKTALEIWADIEGFAKYGFNKSHAIEYAIILLWTMYAKYHHPKEFLLASIRTVDKDKKVRYVQEAQRFGIEVLPPMFGKAQWQASLVDDALMFGWNDVSGFGKFVSQWLVENTQEFMTREEFEEMRKERKYVAPNGSKRVAINSAQIDKLDSLGIFAEYGETTPMTKEQRIEIEETLLGIALSDDSATILEDHTEAIDEYCVPYIATEEPGEYAIAGVIRDIQNKTTKTGKPYAVVKIADSTDEAEFYVWNEELKRLGFIWRNRNAGIFNVKKTERGMSLLDAVILHRKDGPRTKYESRLAAVR